MRTSHPSEVQLQRYLNKSLPELDQRRVEKHVKTCSVCQKICRDLGRIEAMLTRLPLFQPSDQFVQRVMEHMEQSPHRDPAHLAHNPKLVFRWSRYSELTHGLIAAAATYLFISSGVWKQLVTINPQQLEQSVQLSISDFTVWMEGVSFLFFK